MGRDFKHVHLIGHSAGSWAINSAAKILAESDESLQVHLTFLDAFVPPDWPEEALGDIGEKNISLVEHYYTADITYTSTQSELPKAYNVDITAVDPWVKEHEFPYRWYHATITGEYGIWKLEKSEKVISSVGGIEYGFARSAEAGQSNWLKSLGLKRGNKAVKMRKKPKGDKKKWFNLDLLK